MAAAPPPYSNRDARRMARDIARAQRAQYRAQYAYMRYRPSFVGPLLLIAVGVIALLLETGRLDAANFWPWYARWWPTLLIFVGLGLLAEYFLDRNNPNGGRRSLGGIVWLIVLLSLAGGASHAAARFAPWTDQFSDSFGDHGDWFSMLGEAHTEVHTLVQPIAPTGTLTIENARGAVQVATAVAGGPNEVRVEASQTVHASSDETARRDLDATRATLTGHGAEATLSAAGRQGASVDLKVTVPSGIALIVHTTHGDLTLSGVQRDVQISQAHGDVILDNLGAGVHIQMDHGDITARGIGGDLTIDGRADDVSVSSVKGRSLLNGDFFGDTRLEGIGSLVHFHSSRTDLEVPKLGGEMTMDSGNLRLVNPSGGLHLSTRSKDIEVTDLVGDAHIENSNGDVNVSAQMPLGNLDLTDHTGSMTVSVPANASFSVHGTAGGDDEVKTDFGLSIETDAGRKTLGGQVGQGGPHLELATSHGDLTLNRSGAHAPQSGDASERPEAPERPEVPEHPARHLHSKAEAPPQTSVQ